jgi:hemerythrin
LRPNGVKSTKGWLQPDAGNEPSVAWQPKKNVNAQPATIVKSISRSERRPARAHNGRTAMLAWQRSPDINRREIDSQHRMLVTLMTDLHDVMKFARGTETIGDVFDEVVEYANYHFTVEERLMRDSRYPGYLLHKAVHDDVRARLLDLREQFEKGGRGAVSTATLQFLRDWLISHIAAEDQAMVRHLNGQTVGSPSLVATSIH